MNKSVAEVIFGLPVDGPFDYSVDKTFQKEIALGKRVRVLFNRQRRVGFVVGFKQRSKFKRLNPILSVLDQEPTVDKNALELTKSMSRDFGCSWGEAIETYLPRELRKGTPFVPEKESSKLKRKTTQSKITLIHDLSLTKRFDYLQEKITGCLKKKESVIFLVPEISHIAHITARLKKIFDEKIIAYDKKISPKSELELWAKIKSGEPSIIIGTRSHIFAPTPHLGLIIIYDEENRSYKQEQSPHYHAHEVALARESQEKCDLIFVSSSPSAETWVKAKKLKWEKLTFESESLAQIQMVDMTNYNPRKSSLISFPLQNAIQKTVEEGGKVLLFLNRKGFSTLTRCNECGFTLRCERCDVNMTYLYSKKKMHCRLCQKEEDLPKICPGCNGKYLRSMGRGIEKIESELSRIYPHLFIDTFEKESKALSKKTQIIVATQAIFKARANLDVDLVAVLNFDAELNHLDFRSAHRAFTLLVHLRQIAKRKLIIQTRMMDNYCLKAIKSMNFDYFYRNEMKHRRMLGFPPAKHLVSIGLRGIKEESVFEQSNALYERLVENLPKGIEVLEPNPDVNPKLRDKYRYNILLKGSLVKSMLNLTKGSLKGMKRRSKIVTTIDVDY